MAFPVDTTDDYQWVDGVEDATYIPPIGVPTSCQAKRVELTRGELSGHVIGVGPADVPWIVWGLTAAAEAESKLVVAGVAYTITSVAYRGDGAQQRLVGRKAV